MIKSLLKILLGIIGIAALIAFLLVGYIWFKIEQKERTAGRKVEWDPRNGTIHRNLKYDQGSRNVYDLFLPPNKESNTLMLFVHGGSWISGNKEDIEWAARRYTKEGYVSATINYSRAGRDTLHLDGEKSAPSIESMMEEVDRAISSIVQECSRRGITLSQMAIGGYSAGGHLAMLYATRHAKDSAIPIRFLISWVGPADFTLLFPTDKEKMDKIWSENNEENISKRKEYQRSMYFLSGETIQIDSYSAMFEDSLKRKVSPLFHISKNTPPAILVYGARDQLVSARHGELVSLSLRQNGVDNRLFVYPNSGHDLGDDPEYVDSVQSAILDFCQRYFHPGNP